MLIYNQLLVALSQWLVICRYSVFVLTLIYGLSLDCPVVELNYFFWTIAGTHNYTRIQNKTKSNVFAFDQIPVAYMQWKVDACRQTLARDTPKGDWNNITGRCNPSKHPEEFKLFALPFNMLSALFRNLSGHFLCKSNQTGFHSVFIIIHCNGTVLSWKRGTLGFVGWFTLQPHFKLEKHQWVRVKKAMSFPRPKTGPVVKWAETRLQGKECSRQSDKSCSRSLYKSLIKSWEDTQEKCTSHKKAYQISVSEIKRKYLNKAIQTYI